MVDTRGAYLIDARGLVLASYAFATEPRLDIVTPGYLASHFGTVALVAAPESAVVWVGSSPEVTGDPVLSLPECAECSDDPSSVLVAAPGLSLRCSCCGGAL